MILPFEDMKHIHKSRLFFFWFICQNTYNKKREIKMAEFYIVRQPDVVIYIYFFVKKKQLLLSLKHLN